MKSLILFISRFFFYYLILLFKLFLCRKQLYRYFLRYGITELLLDPAWLENVEPSSFLVSCSLVYLSVIWGIAILWMKLVTKVFIYLVMYHLVFDSSLHLVLKFFLYFVLETAKIYCFSQIDHLIVLFWLK